MPLTKWGQMCEQSYLELDDNFSKVRAIVFRNFPAKQQFRTVHFVIVQFVIHIVAATAFKMALIHFPCLANWCKAALAKLQFRSLYHFVLFGVVLLQVSSRLIEILQRHIYSSTWGVDSVVQFHSATFRPSLRVVLEIYTSIWGVSSSSCFGTDIDCNRCLLRAKFGFETPC